jgi:hypothetical protein
MIRKIVYVYYIKSEYLVIRNNNWQLHLITKNSGKYDKSRDNTRGIGKFPD